ncbi:MAG: hypothetical protein ACHQEM_02180 [Chitinophagales bacterium]
MKRNSMYFDTHRVKVYRAYYRPSSNIYRLFRTILTLLVEGHSPMGAREYHYAKKKK